jgi:hypothetical protein
MAASEGVLELESMRARHIGEIVLSNVLSP